MSLGQNGSAHRCGITPSIAPPSKPPDCLGRLTARRTGEARAKHHSASGGSEELRSPKEFVFEPRGSDPQVPPDGMDLKENNVPLQPNGFKVPSESSRAFVAPDCIRCAVTQRMCLKSPGVLNQQSLVFSIDESHSSRSQHFTIHQIP